MNRQLSFLHGGQSGLPLATWSPCKAYRYTLRRVLASVPEPRQIAFLLLNPSTATEFVEDPTIRRCLDFARRWGFHELDIINVYGLRSTDPKGLWKVEDPVGEGNDQAIADVVARVERVICGWGKNARPERVGRIAELLAPARDRVFALAVNGDGSPQHPLYLPATTEPQPYEPVPPPARSKRSRRVAA